MSGANGQEPQQLPDETGAEFAKRLRLIATNIEEIVGQVTIDSNYLRMKAAIVEAQWLFAEHIFGVRVSVFLYAYYVYLMFFGRCD